ncbi:hypothetical protein Scep_012050 [Stephania cephalantha]|uniref:Uncharacterized protein n=1 Tax=Stephania cephalantha TaxID=152367 RepID=A0AAP0JEP4_9MAGN
MQILVKFVFFKEILELRPPLKAMVCKNDSTRLFESSIGRGDLCDCIVSIP